MAEIVRVILRSLDDVLKSMENYHELPSEGYLHWRIYLLKHEIAAAFRQGYVARANQGQGEGIRDGHHRLMVHLLHEIRARNYKFSEALNDPRLRLELCTEGFYLDLDWILRSPRRYVELLKNMRCQFNLKLMGNRHIRRRNKQRHRRAVRRLSLALGELELSIWKLIVEAMKYHLICSIENEQGRSFKFSVVSREIDVTVIEVMTTLFPRRRYQVTSFIDLVRRFPWYNVVRCIQDRDGPWQYRLTLRL